MYWLKRKPKIFKSACMALAFILAFSLILPTDALAARSHAGGGKVAKFSAGRFLINTGITVGAIIVMPAIFNGLNAGSAIGTAPKGAQVAGQLPIGEIGKEVGDTGIKIGQTFESLPVNMLPDLAKNGATIQQAGTTLQVVEVSKFAGNWSQPFLGLSFNAANLNPAAAIQNSSIAIGQSFSAFAAAPLQTAIRGYSTFVAVSQVGRAVSMAGNYYGWKPSTTFLISSGVSGAVGGLLNPSVVLGDAMTYTTPTTVYGAVNPVAVANAVTQNAMLKGALVGGVMGLASGAATIAVDGGRINKGKGPGIGGQIAGLFAGALAGNFARGLVDLDTYQLGNRRMYAEAGNPAAENLAAQIQMTDDFGETLKSMGLSDQSRLTDLMNAPLKEQLANTPQLYRQASVSPGSAQPQYTGEPVTAEQVMGSGKLLLRENILPGGIRTFEVADYNSWSNGGISSSGISKNLLTSTFVNTLNSWPELAVRSLSIAATSSLSKKKQWLAPLVSSVVEGVTGPFIYGAAETFALRPGLYIGQGHEMNASQFTTQAWQNMVYVNQAARTREPLFKTWRQYQDNVMDHYRVKSWDDLTVEQRNEAIGKFDLKGRFESTLASLDIKNNEGKPIELAKVLDVREQADWIKNQLKEQKDITTSELTATMGRIRKDMSKPTWGLDKFYVAQADSLVGQYNNSLLTPDKEYNPATGGYSLENGPVNLDDALRLTGRSRTQLYFQNAFKEAKFGLIEGLVSGGITSLGSKLSQNNPAAAAAAAYGATLLTGAVRGAVLYAGWEPDKNARYGDLMWMDRWDMYKPAIETPGEDSGKRNALEQASTDLNFVSQKQEAGRFARESMLGSGKENRTIYKKIAIGPDTYKVILEIKPVEGYNLRFYGDNASKPTLAESILFSMQEANSQFVMRAFTFGVPLTSDPAKISTLASLDYINALNGYAMSAGRPGWLNAALSSGMVNAGSSTISNNVLTSMAGIRPIANLLGMQTMRIVRSDSPTAPLTFQSSDYQPWKLGFDTRFWLPSLYNTAIRGRSSSGKYYGRD